MKDKIVQWPKDNAYIQINPVDTNDSHVTFLHYTATIPIGRNQLTERKKNNTTSLNIICHIQRLHNLRVIEWVETLLYILTGMVNVKMENGKGGKSGKNKTKIKKERKCPPLLSPPL